MSLKEFSNSSLGTFKNSCAMAFGGFYEDSKLRVMSALHNYFCKNHSIFTYFICASAQNTMLNLKDKVCRELVWSYSFTQQAKTKAQREEVTTQVGYLVVKQDLGLRVAELPEA